MYLYISKENNKS